MAEGTRTLKEAPTLELVLKRNPVERLKREKSPLAMLGELPALIATGYADIEEEDLVRLKWWGAYHDKPKVGTFMLRIKLPAGRITPEQLRTIGELSNEHGRGAGELTTRQTIQLHYLELGSLPTVFDRLRDAGLTTVGACGDAVRNLTGCPVAGLAHDELFDVTALHAEVTEFFYGNPDYSDLPRKHKISISACAHRCNAPEINCISLVGVIRDGERGFAVLVGGGLSSVPRIARDLGVWIREDEAMPVMRALLDAWKEDLRYRLSRVKARMKFMVDDRGPGGHAGGGRATTRVRATRLHARAARPRAGRSHGRRGRARTPPVHGRSTRAPRADLRRPDARRRRPGREPGPGHPPDAAAEPRRHRHPGRRRPPREALAEIGFPVDANRLRSNAIGCTGEPHCNFAVAETKGRLGGLIEHLERRFGNDVSELRLHLDGCPHACGQHWVGDLGFQGTTVRDAEGKRHQGYDVLLRGALGPVAAIGRPVFRRVPTEELDETVERLIVAWLEGRSPGESFRAYCDRKTDDELGVLIGREPARSRRDVKAPEEEAA